MKIEIKSVQPHLNLSDCKPGQIVKMSINQDTFLVIRSLNGVLNSKTGIGLGLVSLESWDGAYGCAEKTRDWAVTVIGEAVFSS